MEAAVHKAKEEKKNVEDRLVELDKQASEIARNNSEYLKQVSELETANRQLNTQLEETWGKLKKVESIKDTVVHERGEFKGQVKNLQQVNGNLSAENKALKLEV